MIVWATSDPLVFTQSPVVYFKPVFNSTHSQLKKGKHMNKPRITLIEKGTPPYPLGQFPEGTVLRIAGEIVYLLFACGESRLADFTWEQIFATAVGAEWTPAVACLDNIRMGSTCCWRAKTVKDTKPLKAKRVSLISGPKRGGITRIIMAILEDLIRMSWGE